MSDERPAGIDRLPTLTEVVELGHAPLVDFDAGADPATLLPQPVTLPFQPVALAPQPMTQSAPPPVPPMTPVAMSLPPAASYAAVPPPPVDSEQLVAQVLGELEPRIDLLLESRLRLALAPALARAADGLIREARVELTASLRDLVEEAVARALHRRGGR